MGCEAAPSVPAPNGGFPLHNVTRFFLPFLPSFLSFLPWQILYFYDGKAALPPKEFKDRVQFIGDINKKDVSIRLNPAQFSDNGTYFCDVKNPPDFMGTPARTELRVVSRGERQPASQPKFGLKFCDDPALVVLILKGTLGLPLVVFERLTAPSLF